MKIMPDIGHCNARPWCYGSPMNGRTRALLEQATALPAGERIELANRIYASLDVRRDEAVDDALRREIEARFSGHVFAEDED
jgi:putative addiction module component (TIGR02574 family)